MFRLALAVFELVTMLDLFFSFVSPFSLLFFFYEDLVNTYSVSQAVVDVESSTVNPSKLFFTFLELTAWK